MPFYYDITRQTTSNGSAGTETTHLWGTTIANQETVGITGVYFASRFGTAGGAIGRCKTNTGTVASGGTSTTPGVKSMGGAPAASSAWKNDATTITAGATLAQRFAVGFAQTGGNGGWVPPEASAKLQMKPNAVNPVDVEFTSVANSASVTFDLTVEFSEGI